MVRVRQGCAGWSLGFLKVLKGKKQAVAKDEEDRRFGHACMGTYVLEPCRTSRLAVLFYDLLIGKRI
jgi:hypothetical protein